jgi:hypothetical protein
LLVGFAGNNPQTQSCTIRALIFNIKANISHSFEAVKTGEDLNVDSDDEEEKKADSYVKLVASTPEIQSFMNKVTRIIALFLKDAKAPKELYRSVLKFIKIAITYLDFTASPEMLAIIL